MGFDSDLDIAVIPNGISEHFSRTAKDLTKTLARRRQDPQSIVLGYIGRGYVHKNLSILPKIRQLLWDRFGIKSAVLTTLTSDEMRRNGLHVQSGIATTGPIPPQQSPEFFDRIDALVFPSVLECFSSTPLEAMAMGKPAFVSDLPFLHDCCGEHAMYFNPLDPNDAAQRIAEWLALGQTDREAWLRAAHTYVTALPSASDRAELYWSEIKKVTNFGCKSSRK